MKFTRELTLELLNLIWLPLIDRRLICYKPGTEEKLNHTFRTACVSIAGPESFAVFIDYSEPMASKITAAMFDTSVEKLDESEIKDALGEFVNMLAGEFEEIINGNYQIGIPVVSDSRDHMLRIPNASILTECCAIDGKDLIRVAFIRTEAR